MIPLSRLELALAFFDEARELFGIPARPLSLASREAIRLMGLRLLDPDPAYAGPDDELREMAVYVWLHTAPLADVTDGLRSGAWRAVAADLDPASYSAEETLPLWRDERIGLAALVAAVAYDVRPRPRPAPAKGASARQDETPPDVIEPSRLAFRLRLLMRDTGASRVDALWEWPYGQAMQMCQAAQRWEGQWTVPAMERTGPADFSGFDLGGDAADIDTPPAA